MAEYRRVLRDQGPRRPRRGPAPNPIDTENVCRLIQFSERVNMNTYRIVVVDDTGKATRQRSFVCGNDDDAIVWAKQLEAETPIELWSGARFVARLERDTRAGT